MPQYVYVYGWVIGCLREFYEEKWSRYIESALYFVAMAFSKSYIFRDN